MTQNISDVCNIKSINSLENIPIYGHTMKVHKHMAYIYGGISQDVLQDLKIFNLKTMSLITGKPAPFRRR